MKHLHKLAFLLLFAGLTHHASAQVGIGTTSPNSKAALDLQATDKGFLMPRMTAAQRVAISSPPKGLLVFDNDSSYVMYYDGMIWRGLKGSGLTAASGGSSPWAISGSDIYNSNSGNVGIGTTTPAYKLDVSGPVNADSLMLGGARVMSTKGTNNLFLGQDAGLKNSGSANYFSGYQAGYSNTTGSQNHFSGYQTGFSNTTGYRNHFSGFWAGYSNTTGSSNYFSGYKAGIFNTTGNYNYFSGINAGGSNTTGENNYFSGYSAGAGNTTGYNNYFSGMGAGHNNSTGSSNTGVGTMAGFFNDGSRNTFLGDSADASANNLTNAMALGYKAKVGQSNSIVLGDGNANVGVGTSTPNTTAVLDLTSTEKGVLIPRMTTTQRNAITSPATGLMVYDNSLNAFYYYNGSAWTAIGGSSSGPWASGSGSVTLATSTDNVGVGKTPTYKLDVSGPVNADSLMLGGVRVMSTKPSTFGSTFTNLFIGQDAGRNNTTGPFNHFSGYQAGYSNTTGARNHFSGYRAGYSNTTASWNHFSGHQAGYSNTTGNNNYISGHNAGFNTTTGSYNHFSGGGAGFNNTTGSWNHFSGYLAGYRNRTGENNYFSGYEAGYNTTTGYSNTAVGTMAGYGAFNWNGSRNTFLGDSADVSANNLTNAMALGYNAKVGQSNSIVLGNGSANVGVGTSTPNTTAVLDLTSTSKGVLIPRMTTTQRNAITSPATGLMVYDNSLNAFYYYNGSAWTAIGGTYTAGNGISIASGAITNTGDTDSSNDITTSSSAGGDVSGSFSSLTVAKIQGRSVSTTAPSNGQVLQYNGTSTNWEPVSAQWTTSGSDISNSNSGNVGIGTSTPNTNAVLDITSTSKGVLIPRMTTAQRTAISSPATGLMVYDNTLNAFYYYNGSAWTAIGGPMHKGISNLIYGKDAGASLTTGYQNTFLGDSAGVSNTTGSYNHFSGYAAGYSNTTGHWNYFSGTYAGTSNTTGYANHFSGFDAGYSNTTGYANHFSGYMAGASNTTGSYNYFSGYQAGTSNTTGGNNHFSGYQAGTSNTTGGNNHFSGYQAGASNTTGGNNHFSGYQAGASNTTGNYNHFSGYATGVSNTTGSFNQFTGYQAGYSNTTGAENYFSGIWAGYSNTTGSYNHISGIGAGYGNTTGYSNHISGYYAGASNTTGYENYFSGQSAGRSNTTGYHNTMIGQGADVTANNLTNAMAIGYNVKVGADNKVIVGNSSITYIGGQVGWTTISDARYKKDVKSYSLGLDFINRLRPVSYVYNNSENGITYHGFLAQEVEKTLQEIGADFSGLCKPQNEKDNYGIRYGDFVVPLVNAVKELSKDKEELQAKNAQLEARLAKLEEKAATQNSDATSDLKAQLESLRQAQIACCRQMGNLELAATLDIPVLEQNTPNPAAESTTIRYYLPASAKSATLNIVTTEGKTLQSFALKGTGNGQVIISAGLLPAATYHYNLVADGVQVDSKKMVIVK